ncbi:MAG: hypothetical protein GXP10_05385, partial [Gammaproteobacteria bacterium]|nr:hypothetical protein [Gammaproteobacteria bacterium]
MFFTNRASRLTGKTGALFFALSLLLLSNVLLAAAPYPPSSVITGITFDWSTHDTRAQDSDNFAITWAADDHQYTTWGDGPGFEGGGKFSLGVSRIEGTANSYTATDIYEAKSVVVPGTFDGKSYGILELNGVMYQWLRQVDDLSGNTLPTQALMSRSTDGGSTWEQGFYYDQSATNLISPTFLQFGRGYDGALDNFVYSYFIHAPRCWGCFRTWSDADAYITLARVPKDKLMDRASYEFFTGLVGGNPTWSSDVSKNKPVFQDPSGGISWSASVSYNPHINRYLLTTEHSETFQGNIAIYDAPTPWGPWTTVLYENGWAGSTFFWNFSNKFNNDMATTGDGKDFSIVFTGIGTWDRWNELKGRFTVAGGGGGGGPITPAPTLSLGATSTSILSGESAQLTWSTTDANSCTASGGWSGSQATSGSASIGPLSATSTFTLNCSGDGGSIEKSIQVTVTTPTAPTLTFGATNNSILSGASTTLTWSTSNASACTASGDWGGSKATSGSTSTGTLTATSTFTLDCSGSGGNIQKSVQVTVAAPVPTLSFSAASNSLLAGESTQLTWSSTNASSCFASVGWSGTKATSGSASTGALSANSTFTLNCSGSGGSIEKSVQVTVTTPAAPTLTFNAANSSILSGESTTLTWSTS